MTAWTSTLKRGDLARVKDYWNATTRADTIAVPTVVLGIKRGVISQSGVMICVATRTRKEVWLDAAWFEATGE